VQASNIVKGVKLSTPRVLARDRAKIYAAERRELLKQVDGQQDLESRRTQLPIV